MVYELVAEPVGIVTCEVRREGKLISKVSGRNALTPKVKEVMAKLMAGGTIAGGTDPQPLDDSAEATYMQVIFPVANNAGRISSVGSTVANGSDSASYGRAVGTHPLVAVNSVEQHSATTPNTWKLQYQQVFKDIKTTATGHKLAFRLYGGRAVGTAGAGPTAGAGSATRALATINANANTSADYIEYELWGEKIDVAPGVVIVEGDSVTCTYQLFPALAFPVASGEANSTNSLPYSDYLLCKAMANSSATVRADCALASIGSYYAEAGTYNTVVHGGTAPNLLPIHAQELETFAGTAKTGSGASPTNFGTADFSARWIYATDSTAGTYDHLGYTPTNGTPVTPAPGANLVGDSGKPTVAASKGIYRAGIQKSVDTYAPGDDVGDLPIGGWVGVDYAGNDTSYLADPGALARVSAVSIGNLGYSAANRNKRHSFQFRVRFN